MIVERRSWSVGNDVWDVLFYPSTLVGLAELLAETGAAKQRGEGATKQT